MSLPGQEYFDFHFGKATSNARSWSKTERQIHKRIGRLGRGAFNSSGSLLQPTFGYELIGFWIVHLFGLQDNCCHGHFNL